VKEVCVGTLRTLYIDWMRRIVFA